MAGDALPDLTAELNAGAVSATLGSTVPVALEEAVKPESDLGLPSAPGFYAWWVRRDAIAGVPHLPHPADRELDLLYVGISPKRATSGGLIRSRVIDQHVRGNTSSSTLRFALAALLLDTLELAPRATAKKYVLDSDDNRRLRDWQFDHLSLTWCERKRPWEVEDAVIALMQPPLNCATNEGHPFYPTISAAREAFRVAARRRRLSP